MNTVTDVLNGVQRCSTIALTLATAYGLAKLVRYFTSTGEEKSSFEKESALEWNKNNHILIGHENTTQSILKTLVNDKETMINEITFNKVSERFRKIRSEFGEDSEVHIHLRTPGGEMYFAMLIAQIVSKWKGKVIAHIHAYSASGGTLIALACSEIHMDELSALGAIDPQVPRAQSYYSATTHLQAIGIDPTTIDDDFSLQDAIYAIPANRSMSLENATEVETECEEEAPSDIDDTVRETETVEFHIDSDGVRVTNAENANKAAQKAHDPRALIDANVTIIKTVNMLRTYKKFLLRILQKNYPDQATVERIICFFWMKHDHSSPIWREDCIQVGLNVVEAKE